MTIQSAQQQTLLLLKKLYDEREASNITDWVMEHVTGKKRVDRLVDKLIDLSDSQQSALTHILQELASHKPIQYVLGEAWFAGMKFYINEQVLIPRPETEELVHWIEEEYRISNIEYRMLMDIGTGSGCIPITLKKKLPGLSVTSIDVSSEALKVAKKNAEILEADITLLNIDFLAEENWSGLPVADIIVSNPPYIKQSERNSMSDNVLGFEPSIALFVPDEDALLFYRKIALFGKSHLSPGGILFLEINETLGRELVELFSSFGYDTQLKKDMQGKDRMVRGNLKI